MSGRDDKWLGQTALAVLLYLELARRELLDGETQRTCYPRALRALAWLRRMSDAGALPAGRLRPGHRPHPAPAGLEHHLADGAHRRRRCSPGRRSNPWGPGAPG